MKKVLTPIDTWEHEEVWSCLQTSVAAVLTHYGLDPRVALGSCWDFYHEPGAVCYTEYDYPLRWPDLIRCLSPHYPLRSAWHQPADDEEGWRQVKEAIDRGGPAIIAVDNFYLPYRPAYQDVHANHLVVAYGYDEETGEVYVLDGSPPGCHGAIPGAWLQRARSSVNPAEGERDLFFAGSPIDNRWLEITLTGDPPELSREWVREVVADNLERMRASGSEGCYSCLDGMSRYFADIDRRARGGDGSAAMDELYIFGYSAQASSALHGEFLQHAGRKLDWPELQEAGRWVDRIAHHWTVVRVMGAHGREAPQEMAPQLARRASCLQHDTEATLALIDWVMEGKISCPVGIRREVVA